MQRETQEPSTMKQRLRSLLEKNPHVWKLARDMRYRFHVSFGPSLRAKPVLEPEMSVEEWIKAGKPIPSPHLIKERILSAYASAFRVSTLIETGTYYGDMVFAMRNQFEKIISIELSRALCNRARRRFRSFGHIAIMHGDSGKVLPAILRNMSQRCVFWLDGHYSYGVTAKGATETPIMEEVETILQHRIKDHVILIDDARCYGTNGYPKLEELREIIEKHRPGYQFSVLNDVIRIHPKQCVQTEF